MRETSEEAAAERKLHLPKTPRKLTQWDRARRHLIAGLLVIVPVFIAGWAVVFIANLAEQLFGHPVHYIFQLDRIPQSVWMNVLDRVLSLLLALLVIMAIGWLSTFLFVRRLISLGEKIVGKVPLVKFFYLTPKEVLNTLTMPRENSYKRVVLIEYPRRGVWCFAFATGELTKQPDGTRMIAVFLPTTPNPTSGFLLFLPEEDVWDTNVSVEDGARLIISGGILTPQEVHTDKFCGLGREPNLPPLGPLYTVTESHETKPFENAEPEHENID